MCKREADAGHFSPRRQTNTRKLWLSCQKKKRKISNIQVPESEKRTYRLGKSLFQTAPLLSFTCFKLKKFQSFCQVWSAVWNRFPFGLLVKFKLWSLAIFEISIIFQRLSCDLMMVSWATLASQSCWEVSRPKAVGNTKLAHCCE